MPLSGSSSTASNPREAMNPNSTDRQSWLIGIT